MAVFNIQSVLHDEDKKELNNEEKDICRYISQNCEDDYEYLILNDNRWKVFYHLTRMRKSLLNWYSFKKDATLLEIGGSFGDLTGLYCDKCKQVVSIERFLYRAEQIYERHKNRDNLTVYAGRVEDIPLKEKFDYITVIGTLEYRGNGKSERKLYSEYLENLKELLKPDGKIILAVENRYGLRYFCGAPEPHTGIPFSGINRYPYENNGYSFSKQEIIDIIEMAGFTYHKFYFPLPDYKLPQVIYSQDYIPKTSLKERVIPYYLNHSSLLAYENDIFDDIIENNVLDFFSNSFLVECSIEQKFCDVIYAAVSTDRGREEGFATTIHNSNLVKKTPLYPEGITRLENIYKNHIDLKSHNLSVIDSKIINNSLCMPYIKYNTLSDYLKKIIGKDPKQFILMFDKLFDCILQSSTHILREDNALLSYDDTVDYGVILEKAYIDMIPVNCFYHDGNFIFFDQEFLKECYPAKYVLFRALKYTYFFISDAEKYIPLNDLKIKYGLVDLWDIFEKEEYNFVSLNRKYDENRSFFARAYVDKEHMYENAKRLLQ
jgi:SAM-dependent methyltransferase